MQIARQSKQKGLDTVNRKENGDCALKNKAEMLDKLGGLLYLFLREHHFVCIISDLSFR